MRKDRWVDLRFSTEIGGLLGRRTGFTWLAGAVVVLLTALVFRGVLEAGFLNWDDGFLVFNNLTLRKLDGAHLLAFFTTFEAGNYAPLARFSLAVDYAIWGNSPFGFHFTNLVLHVLNAYLVYRISLKLLSLAQKESTSFQIVMGSGVAALLFAVHPLRVESVAWVSERRDVLSGFFSLLCSAAYIRFRTSGVGKTWFWMAFFFFLCAVAAKSVAVALPLVLLLLDGYFLAALRNQTAGSLSLKRLVVEKIPWFGVSLFAGLIALGAQYQVGAMGGVRAVGFGPRLTGSLSSVTHYLFQALVPLRLNPLYFMYHTNTWDEWPVWMGLAWLVGGSIVLWRIRHLFPSALAAWGSCFVIILPLLGGAFDGLQRAADRYTYMASIPVCIWGGGALLWMWRSPQMTLFIRIILGLLMAAILAGWSWLSEIQTRVWKNDVSLWSHSIRLDPGNPVAWINLGKAWSNCGKWNESIDCCEKLLLLAPDLRTRWGGDAWYQMANSLKRSGRSAEALVAYERAMAQRPLDLALRRRLAWLYVELGHPAKALEHYELIQRLAPSPSTASSIVLCRKLQNRHAERSTSGAYGD